MPAPWRLLQCGPRGGRELGAGHGPEAAAVIGCRRGGVVPGNRQRWVCGCFAVEARPRSPPHSAGVSGPLPPPGAVTPCESRGLALHWPLPAAPGPCGACPVGRAPRGPGAPGGEKSQCQVLEDGGVVAPRCAQGSSVASGCCACHKAAEEGPCKPSLKQDSPAPPYSQLSAEYSLELSVDVYMTISVKRFTETMKSQGCFEEPRTPGLCLVELFAA